MLGILKVKMSLEYPTFETAFESGLSKTRYKVADIKDHRKQQGEMQYLITFVSFDSFEDMWLSIAQLEHAPVLL